MQRCFFASYFLHPLLRSSKKVNAEMAFGVRLLDEQEIDQALEVFTKVPQERVQKISKGFIAALGDFSQDF